MKKRVLGILLATYLGAAMLTGCSQTESTDGESTAAAAKDEGSGDGWTGGYVCHSANVFFDAIEKGLVEAA